MPRFRIPFNAEAVFIGPAHATGYHFITRDGELNNNFSDINNINLVTHLNRVQSFNYSQENQLTPVPAFGKKGTIKRYASSPARITFSFDYLQYGVRNEDKLGFYVNYPNMQSPNSGDPIYPNNYNVFLLNGFHSNSDARQTNANQWPMEYRDCKNLFLSVGSGVGLDFNSETTSTAVKRGHVLGFGNCYLSSYNARAAVGDFPKAQVSFVAENLSQYSENTGQTIPAISPKTFTPLTGRYFNIPNNYDYSNVSVLLPGDISFDFSGYSQVNAPILSGIANYGAPTSVNNLSFNFNNLQIINYDINIDLPRKATNSLNYKVPINRKVSFPVYANLNLRVIVNDYIMGSSRELFNNEQDYDLTIRLKNPITAPVQGDGIRYDFRKAKLINYNFESAIGDNKVASFTFSTELSPSDLTKGLFISGLYNTEVTQQSGYILMEDGSKILFENSTDALLMETFGYIN